MPNLSELLQHGSANLWLFIPTAIALGALHGLEPGHSKTLMAAFIVAIRGTVWQAVLLGLCAAFSHSLIIWALAAVALHYGPAWNADTTEPYLQIASAALILGLAVWMYWRTRRDVRAAADHHHHHHGGDGPRGGKIIDTGRELVELSVYETNVPPRFRLHFYDQAKRPRKPTASGRFTIEIVRPNGAKEQFTFDDREDFLEATSEIGEPHEFAGRLTLSHGNHVHGFAFHFAEGHDHAHGPAHPLPSGNESSADYEDAHQRAHADDIATRFANRTVTTGQIVFFGLTGGLVPCPASLTVLLVCLQLKKFTLGFTLVLSFSLGLAATMVLAGTMAALSVRHAEKHFKGFGAFARRAPYFSCVLLVLMAGYLAYAGFSHLAQ